MLSFSLSVICLPSVRQFFSSIIIIICSPRRPMRAEDRCEKEALCTYKKFKNIERFTPAWRRGQKSARLAGIIEP